MVLGSKGSRFYGPRSDSSEVVENSGASRRKPQKSPGKWDDNSVHLEALARRRGLQNTYLDVSENRGTPKSSILIGFSIINHPFWGTLIFGNTNFFLGGGNSNGIFFRSPKGPQNPWTMKVLHPQNMGWRFLGHHGLNCFAWRGGSWLIRWLVNDIVFPPFSN